MGTHLVVAVVEKILTKVNVRIVRRDKRKGGGLREVAVVESWPSVEARQRRN